MTMNAHLIERHFAKIGARASVREAQWGQAATGVSIDIRRDLAGEYFDIAVQPTASPDLLIIDAQPSIRHLLLMSRQGGEKHKFLCGHDERHWFVAAVPERARAASVQSAFEALKPPAVHARLVEVKVKPRKRNRRRNEAFVRQGEWFFLPAPAWFKPDAKLIFRHEPLRRGGGKPHICEELFRDGGELVYISPRHPNGVTQVQYRRLLERQPKLRNLHWQAQRRNPMVFVRGKVRHADHKTIVLHGWHQVLMNTETQAVAMRHVAFID
jgi:hypothetical protein